MIGGARAVIVAQAEGAAHDPVRRHRIDDRHLVDLRDAGIAPALALGRGDAGVDRGFLVMRGSRSEIDMTFPWRSQLALLQSVQ